MPVKIGNKAYRTVAERLTAAHGEAVPVGIQSITTEFVLRGEDILASSTVTFDGGKSFQGHAAVTLGATGNRPEATNPYEVAETSSVGRALALAGYPGSDDGIAGAEEVRGAQARREPAPRQRTQSAQAGQTARRAPQQQPAPDPAPSTGNTADWDALVEQAGALGIRTAATPPPSAMEAATKRLREQIAAKSGEVPPVDAGDAGPCAIDGCQEGVAGYSQDGTGLCEQHFQMLPEDA